MEATSIAEILAENKAQGLDLDENQGLGEDVLMRYWLVGQDDLDGCVAYLKAQTTVVNPMTGTRWARTGTWYAGRVQHRPANENPLLPNPRGLMWVLFQQLSKGDKIITVTEDCAAWTKTRIMHTYNVEIPDGTATKGRIVTVSATPTELGRERTVQETITPKDQVATSYDASMAAESERVLHTENATDLTEPVAVKGTIVRQSAQPTEAGNQRTTVETIVPKDQVATSYDASMAAESERVLHTENSDDLTEPVAVKGTIVRQSAQPTEAGNQRTTVETITPKDQVATSYDASMAAESERVLHTENPDDLTEPTAVKGTIVRQSAQPTEAGNQRTTVETITPKDQVATSYDVSKAVESTRVLHTENPNELTVPEEAKGTIVRQSAQPTEAGNQRTTVETIVPKDQVATSYDASMAAESERVLHTENATDLTEPVAVKGTIVRQSAQPTEAGNQRTTVETITPKDQVATSYDVSKAVESTRVLHTENPDELTVPEEAKGTIVRQSAQPTEAGNQRTTVETIVPKDQVETSYKQDAFEESESELHTENSTPLGEPNEEVGKIKVHKNTPTEAGNARTEKEERTGVERVVSYTAAKSDDVEVVVEKGHNVAALPELAAIENADVLLDGDMNPYQLYDYVKKTATAKVPASCPAAVYWETYGNKYWVYHRGHNNPSSGGTIDYIDAQYLYQERWYTGIQYFLTAALASEALPVMAVAAGGADAKPEAGSRISRVGGNLWEAHVVTRVDKLLYTKTWTLIVNPDGSWYTT